MDSSALFICYPGSCLYGYQNQSMDVTEHRIEMYISRAPVLGSLLNRLDR